MEEIWNSLSTFRKVLNFTDGWEVAQMNAWHRLNAAATSKLIMIFIPVSAMHNMYLF